MTANTTQDDDPTTPLVVVADWLTEELAQELYAARQDLADAAVDVPGCADEADTLREVLLMIIRRLHDVAEVLRAHDDGSLPVERIEELSDRIADDCRAAEASMARGRSVLERHAGRDDQPRGSRTGAPRSAGRRLVALRGGPPALRTRDDASAQHRRRRAC